MDSIKNQHDLGWTRLAALGVSAGREQWASALAEGIEQAFAPWLVTPGRLCEMDGVARAERLAQERAAISFALDGFGRAANSGHWVSAVDALGVVSGKPWALGRAEVGRVVMNMAARAGSEHAASRYELLGQCAFFDKNSEWTKAEANLKMDYWPTTSGRDEDPGDEMGCLLLAKTQRPKELSTRSMGILIQSRVESTSMFPEDFDWINAGGRMATAARRRFMSASKLDPEVFDAFPAQAWLGVRATSTKASRLGAWAWSHLLAKAKDDGHLRTMWGAVELMRFDLTDLERFEAEFPGSLSKDAVRGASWAFSDETSKMRQAYLASAALSRPTGKWARPAQKDSKGAAQADSKKDLEWIDVVEALPGVCALFEAFLLKKHAQKAEKKKPKLTARL